MPNTSALPEPETGPNTAPPPTHKAQTPQLELLVGAMGVVYGDIGTSPLYTLRECFVASNLDITSTSILGVLSLIIWSLVMVVTIKYVTFILRADNHGEGGILALTIQATHAIKNTRHGYWVMLLGILGAALFFSDALITPAISVLGAMEGLHVIDSRFDHWVIPLSIVCLVLLFAIQRHGTAQVGSWFGPIMLVWFSILAMLGILGIIQSPQVLYALNPFLGLQFLLTHHIQGFLTLGSVVLAVTGAEALYADLGHFGRPPIQRAWLLLVGPALTLNYVGQGAILLANPDNLTNPFYLLAPEDFRLPLLFIATIATIIAAQAVITGATSLTSQAIRGGFLPHLKIRHTNEDNSGHIFIPSLNLFMLAMVLILVMSFKTSSNLAAAYGIAVAGTMAVSTLLTSAVLYNRFHFPLWAAAGFGATFLAIDFMYILANVHKIPHGGWLPLAIGVVVVVSIHIWIRGREVTRYQTLKKTRPLAELFDEIPLLLKEKKLYRPDRAAVYLTGDLSVVPITLRYNIEHNQCLHKQIVLVQVHRAPVPRVPANRRILVTPADYGFYLVTIVYGFMESPNIPAALNEASLRHDLPFCSRENATYFVGNHTFVPGLSHNKGGLYTLQEPIFMLLESISQPAVRYFRLPASQVIEIGDHLEI